MRRISTSTAKENLWGVGKPGFTSGDKQTGVFPTEIGAEWCNGVQEELVSCIEASGQTPSVDDNLQLAKSIPFLAGHHLDPIANDLIFEWDSEAEPLFPGSSPVQMKTQIKATSGNVPALLCFFEPPNRSAGSVEYTIVIRNASYALGAPDTVVFRQEWRKNNSGVSVSISSAQEIYVNNTLGFTYALDFTNGTVGVSVTPNPGNLTTYRVLVKGEINIIKQDA